MKNLDLDCDVHVFFLGGGQNHLKRDIKRLVYKKIPCNACFVLLVWLLFNLFSG